MNPDTTQKEMQVYGSDATYKSAPNETQMAEGVVPLDTLPAAWWNWLWNQVTSNNNGSLTSIADLRTEMQNVIEQAGLTPSALDPTQLAKAISKVAAGIATATTPGSVISSSDLKSVSVNPTTGEMTVNVMADWTSTQTIEQRVSSAETTITNKVAELDGKIVSPLSNTAKAIGAASGTSYGTTTGGSSTTGSRGDHNHAVTISNGTYNTRGVVFAGEIPYNAAPSSTYGIYLVP